ncbi:actin-binding LIM protein 1-like isoform X7 [Xyrichtys novacula]|uniref:Actin-binding LIM protein 1-like isoform X7 n=1 Tax=Xyrichtys novacula TaxID=13765 RepID=A0AAV1H532_XYRNO|nr:actin-binding LIM protein 1-like isoform X7 [Xyrichtys novacula]
MKEKVLHNDDGCNTPQSGKRAIQCFRCGEPCKGEVLRVQTSYFHIKCFSCKVCGCDLAQSGFFNKNGDYLCPLDFQRLHGTLCSSCGEFVEGEVVTVLGKTYHPACFVCTLCKQRFPAGDCVTFSGKDCLCQRCIRPMSPTPNNVRYPSNCSGCGRDIKNGQALLAMAGQWHLGCFKCKICKKVLSGEYISKDGVPYCERDYQIQFGVQCHACQKFITGKVLEAGHKHYHPSCARCNRCDRIFKEGEEMYLQGKTIWHPYCRDISSRSEDNYRPTSSSESSSSRPGSCTPGSPGRTICSPGNVSEGTEDSLEIRKYIPKSTSHGSFGVHGAYNRHSYTPTLSRSPQHFHMPDDGFNMYRRPPIYKQKDPTTQTLSLPGYGRNSLSQPRSADFSNYNTDRFRGRLNNGGHHLLTHMDRGVSMPNLLEPKASLSV